MRDNGIPEARGQDGLDWFAGLAREALGRLVSVRDQQGVEIKQEHLDLFLELLASDSAVDPTVLLDAMVALHLDPEMVACGYAGEAARSLGESWLSDDLSFVDVTLRTERLHSLVRRVDEMVDTATKPDGRAVLILVAEAEQHTLGAFILALQMRLAGFSAVVKVAPVAADLTVLMAANRFDLALVSIGCTAGLNSGVGLVRTLRLMSRGDMCIFVGGAIPVSDDRLLAETGADRVLRDVSALLTDFDDCVAGRALERDGKRSQKAGARSSAKGDQGDR
jgi:methylmalonyl-CoA mutase cobalamin-binding subunit